MNKFWIIMSHTFMTRFKSKSFLISTLITLALIAAAANLDKFIDLFSGGENGDKIAVIDESGALFTPLKESVAASNEDMELINYDGTEKEAKNAVQKGDYDALVTMKLNNENLPEASYIADTITDSAMQMEIEQQIQQLKVAMATEQAGIDEEKLAAIYEPVSFETIALDTNAKTTEELNQTRGIVYVMLFLLYIAVLMYGQMIATDVATEKSSRVMEILISSAAPITHMFAKIAGIALLGLTQVVVFIAAGYTLIVSNKDALSDGMFEFFGLNDTSLSIYIYAIVFFLLGYLLYATLAAMLGSLVSRVEDVQQLMMPMIFLVMIAFFIAMFGLGAPDSTFVKISSFIPFFTPMVMFLRVGMLDIPVWETALSLGILVASIIILGIIGAKVYKGGVLMYGKSSSLKDFRKAMALSKKEK
jgi:ABC-2 type transport system permease protein